MFCAFMISLVWAVVYYLTGSPQIPGIGARVTMRRALIVVGFLMTMCGGSRRYCLLPHRLR